MSDHGIPLFERISTIKGTISISVSGCSDKSVN